MTPTRWKGRTRPRRLLKRGLWLLCFALGGLALFAAALYFGFRSDYVWRNVIISRYLGPYWDTALSWESMTPQAFPPGVTFEKVVLREPGDDGRIVLSIDEIRAQGTWQTRPDFLDFEKVEVRGVSANYVIYPDGATNLRRAVTRLFEGLPPGPSGRDLPREARIIPRINVRQAALQGVSGRFEDLANGLRARFRADDPLTLRFDPDSRDFAPGRLDQFFGVIGSATMDVRRGDWAMSANLEFDLESADLARFPNNEATGRFTITPPSESYPRFEFSARSPLERVAIRAIAVPFLDVEARLFASDDDALAVLEEGTFDPLRGTMTGRFSSRFSLPALSGAVTPFLDHRSRAMGRTLLTGSPPWTVLAGGAEPAFLTIRSEFEVDGVAQYAAVDPAERMPFRLVSEGTARIERLPLFHLPPWRGELGESWQGEAGLPETGQLDMEWDFDTSERDQTGGVRLEGSVVPTGWAESRLALDFSVAGADGPREKARFNPYGRDVGEALAAFRVPLESRPPPGEFLPRFEKVVRASAAPFTRTFRLIEAMDFRAARFEHRFTARDPLAMKALFSPFLAGVEGGGEGSWEFIAEHPGEGLPPVAHASFAIDRLRLSDFEGELHMEGAAGLQPHRDRLLLSDFDFLLERGGLPSPDAQPAFRVRLSPGPLDGSAGPARPTFFDAATGRGHFELTVDAFSGRIAEVLLRLHPFGLDEHLGRPVPRTLLSLLGFAPGESDARARIGLSGDLARTFHIASLVSLENVPVREDYFGGITAVAPDARTFDARFFQRLSLDRETMTVRPGRFDLTLLPGGGGKEVASLRLEPEDATLGYDDLVGLLAGEMDFLAGESVIPGSTPARRFALAFLDRARRLHSAIAGGGADLVLEVPGAELSSFQPFLSSIGLPPSTGSVDLELRAPLGATASSSIRPGARGTLHFRDIHQEGMHGPIPQIEAHFDLREDETTLFVEDFRTSLALDPDFPPTSINFSGASQIRDRGSSWELAFSSLSPPVRAWLRHLGGGGLFITTRLLDALPAQRLVEISAPEGRVDLHLAGHSPGDGRGQAVNARMEATSLRVFPHTLGAISLATEAGVTFDEDGKLLLERLGGTIHEEGLGEPLLTLSLDEPIRLPEEGRVSLAVHGDLDALAPRLLEMPLPLYGKAVNGGKLTGTADLLLPKGFDSPGGGHLPAPAEFALSLGGLTLERWEKAVSAEISGRLESASSSLSLTEFQMETAVAGEKTGTVEARGVYDYDGDALTGVIDLIGFRGALLDPLPPRLARWRHRPDARLDMQARVEAAPEEGGGNLQLALRARGIGLAPVTLPGGASYAHPPLHLDLDLLSDYDRDAGEATIRDLQLFLAGGSPPPGPRLGRIDRSSPSLLALSQAGPMRFSLGENSLAAAQDHDGALLAEIGPFRVEDYGILVQQIIGLPLVEGLVEGTGELRVAPGNDGPANKLSASLILSEGLWDGQGGSEGFEGRLVLDGIVDGSVLRIDELDLRTEYPAWENASRDHFRARGMYDNSLRRLRLRMDSEELSIDRLVRMAGDLQIIHSRLYPDGIPLQGDGDERHIADSPGIALGFLETLDAEIDATVDRMRFDEISLGGATFRVIYRDSRLVLEELLSEGIGTRLGVKGAVTLTDPAGPWFLDLDISNLDSRPWINTFGPSLLHDHVSGRLTARASITGAGFTAEDLRRNLETNLVMEVRRGEFHLPQVEAVLGKEGAVDAELRLVIRRNRAVFDLVTPWNPWRHLSVKGRVRNVYPAEGEQVWYDTTARLVRTTPVGPPGRTAHWRGETVPFRQELFGVTVDSAGTLHEKEPLIELRNLIY